MAKGVGIGALGEPIWIGTHWEPIGNIGGGLWTGTLDLVSRH